MTKKEYKKWVKKFIKSCKKECKECGCISVNVCYSDMMCRICEKEWQQEIDNKRQEVLDNDK